MTDATNPSRQTPGPDHLEVGDTVSSKSELVTVGPGKAVASGAVGTAVAFLTALIVANSDEVVTGGEWLTVALATVIGGAAAFGVTWATPTSVTRTQ